MTEETAKPRLSIARLLPLVIVVAAVALIVSMGWHEYLRPRAVADSRDMIQGFVDGNLILALLAFMVLYVVVVTLSIPGAAFLTIVGGFLFSAWVGGPAVVVAATIGATIIFLIAKTALGDVLAARAGPFIERLREGFAEGAFNYLLFLRLVPLFPFWLVNIAPAFLGVKTRTFFLATLIGIVPGTLAFSFVGGGLDSIITSAQADPGFQACIAEELSGGVATGSCKLPIDFGDFVTPEILIAFAALGVVALIPVAIRRLRERAAQ